MINFLSTTALKGPKIVKPNSLWTQGAHPIMTSLRSLLFAGVAASAVLPMVPAHAQLPARNGAATAVPNTGFTPLATPGANAPRAFGTETPGQNPGLAAPAQPDLGPSFGGADFSTAPQQPSYTDPSTVRRAQSQAQGNYGDISRTTGIPLGMTQEAWSRPFQNMASGQSAPGVARFQWSPDLVMTIRIRDFMNTTIVLPEWESAQDVYIGESYYMQAAIARNNVVMLRSTQSGIDTSVTILGQSGNLYTFYVRSEGFNTRRLTDMQVFVEAPAQAGGSQWFRSSNAGQRMTAGQALPASHGNSQIPPQQSPALAPPLPGPTPDGRVAPGGAPTGGNIRQGGNDMLVPRDQMIFDMKMFEVAEGDRTISPDYVYSDGVWTYFHFGTRAREADLPVVYRVVDGVETRINTRVAGRFGEVLIAEARGNFTLRSGARAVCVKQGV